MRIATTLRRCRTRRHLLAVGLTSILMTLQPVESVVVDRVAVQPGVGAARSGYEVAGRVCLVHRRCGLVSVTVRSAEDRSLHAPTR